MAMDKQMELFEDGGLMDEGGMVDEVSGNEVPPGSTREEVRDDIPAQLSEGEFVFPADVVRYFGLETLMKMRQEAKAGLQMMEDMGQMGNSEEATIPDDIPFDVNDLDMEDDGVVEYAQGGVVKAQAGTFVQPQGFTGIGGYQPSQFANYQSQYTPYTPPSMPAGQQLAQQYTPVTQQTVPTMTQQVPTFTGFTGMAAPGTGGYDEMKTYVNDAGQEMQIPFKDGNPIYPIPEGYKLKTEAVQTAQTQTTTDTGVETARPDSGDDTSGSGLEKYSTKDVTGIGYDRSKIKHEGIKNVLNEVAKSQAIDFSVPLAVGRAFDLSTPGKTGLAAQFKGVMDNFRGKTTEKGIAGEYDVFADTRNLHDFNPSEYDEIVSRFTEVQNQMKDIYGSTKPDGKFEYKSTEEIRNGLVAKANEFGIKAVDKNGRSKHTRTLEREISYELDRRNQQKKAEQLKQAEEKGQEKRQEREQAAQAASAYGISKTNPDGSIKSASQLRSEMQAEQKSRADAARERLEQARGSDSYQQAQDDGFGGTGYSSGTSFGGTGYETSTGEAMVAEGGLMNKSKLAKQMKQSGLASKK